jgi:hypothetical protein
VVCYVRVNNNDVNAVVAWGCSEALLPDEDENNALDIGMGYLYDIRGNDKYDIKVSDLSGGK